MVYLLDNEKVKNLNFGVNGDKIIFTWSGRKLEDGDYDIYALIYDLVTGIKENIVPEKFAFQLEQNYPNPFNSATTIKYTIPAIGNNVIQSENVILKVFDILGREVATLVNREQAPGNYKIKFNAENSSSGIYYYRVQYGNFVQNRKMILLK